MVQRGKQLTIGISAYMIIKCVLNLILSFNSTNFVTLILTALLVCIMVLPSSTIPAVKVVFKYANYITAVVLALIVLQHISYNIANFPGTWLYLLEAALDIAAIVLLFIQKDIKSYFKSK